MKKETINTTPNHEKEGKFAIPINWKKNCPTIAEKESIFVN